MKLSEVSRLLHDAQECKDLEHYMAECGGSLPGDSFRLSEIGIALQSLMLACRTLVNDVRGLLSRQ